MFFRATISLSLFAALSLTVMGAETSNSDDRESYLLRYQFRPGETLRWEVVHLLKIKMTVSGTTQTAETASKSVKVWKVLETDESGTATFEHRVEDADMRQKLTGRAETQWKSGGDQEVPGAFQSVAETIDVPLAHVTINRRGEVLKKDVKTEYNGLGKEGKITIPLPEKEVSVGDTWTYPYPIVLPTNNGMVERIATQQKFRLEDVRTGVATISMQTQVLTPIDDPAIEAQLVQRLSSGEIRFDIDAGRILSQQMDVDKTVIHPQGEQSSMHYMSRFTEKLLKWENARRQSDSGEQVAGKTPQEETEEVKTAARDAEETQIPQ